MRAVVSRVSSASVVVGGELVGAIGPGLLVLVGVAVGDSEADADALAAKLTGLRIFDDGHGRMNRSVTDVGGGVLVVSQFTLLAETARGRRPSFTGAADAPWQNHWWHGSSPPSTPPGSPPPPGGSAPGWRCLRSTTGR